MVREALEESGIKTSVQAIHKIWTYSENYKGTPTQFLVIGYILRAPSGDIGVVTEHPDQNYRWVSEAEL